MTETRNLQTLLGLSRPPVAVGFFDSPPTGVAAWEGGAVAAGCAFWQQAQAGKTFYTVPADHYNCAVGAYTHGIGLPTERAGELEQTVGFMVQNNYIAMEEVPGIPTLTKSPAVVAYGPVDSAGFKADVVIVAAQPAHAMLLYEAAIKAGAGAALTGTLGRPGCAALPLTVGSGSAALSLGCKGNRTFTGLPDEELYVCIPGARWEAVVDAVGRTLTANANMGTYYNGRKAQFSTTS